MLVMSVMVRIPQMVETMPPDAKVQGRIANSTSSGRKQTRSSHACQPTMNTTVDPGASRVTSKGTSSVPACTRIPSRHGVPSGHWIRTVPPETSTSESPISPFGLGRVAARLVGVEVLAVWNLELKDVLSRAIAIFDRSDNLGRLRGRLLSGNRSHPRKSKRIRLGEPIHRHHTSSCSARILRDARGHPGERPLHPVQIGRVAGSLRKFIDVQEHGSRTAGNRTVIHIDRTDDQVRLTSLGIKPSAPFHHSRTVTRAASTSAAACSNRMGSPVAR